MWAEFLISSLIVAIAPGTGVIYTLGVGLARGSAASIAAAAGCACGILPHMAAAIAGLAAALHASAILFQTVKLAGVVFLLYFAWSILQDDGPIRFNAGTKTASLREIAITGFLINILNPKLSIFFLAFLPQFIPGGSASPVGQIVILSGAFMATTFVVFVFYGAFASRVRNYIERTPSAIPWLKRGFSAAFILLGAKLAFEER